MQNDTEVFDAMRLDGTTGELAWTRRAGTTAALYRDGYVRAPMSQNFCPHEWIDDRGYVDRELARRHPYRHRLQQAQ